MEPTQAQKDKVKSLKDVFGSAITRVSSRLKADGCVHMHLNSMAGEWDWAFDADGELYSAILATRLFDAPATVRVFRVDPNDETSATQRASGSDATAS